MQALAAANVGFNLQQGAAQVQDAISKGDATGGAGISISVGSSSSQSNSQSSADNARGSSVNAGGNVTIQATGAGKDSDIMVRGSNVQAGKATTLKADDQVNLLAAKNTTNESSSHQSKSGSIGLAISAQGTGVTASASRATGQGAGNSTTFTNSQVAGSTVNIESGGDTTLKGAVVQGNQVTATVGGNLNIESLQDTSQYKESSKSAGGSVTVGTGVSGNLNLAQTQINSDFKSVGEQSAIRADDGGFDVSVKGKTDLIGGQITSTQAAVDAGKNTFSSAGGVTTTDLQNSASFEAKSASVGVGTGALPGKSISAGMSGVGFGSDKGSASSATTAGISGVAGDTAARTGDQETGLKAIFDKDKAKAEVAAQVAITQEFGKAGAAFQKAYADGDVTARERDAINRQCDHMIGAVMAFKASVKRVAHE
jgi:filamentous hemagglutinin